MIAVAIEHNFDLVIGLKEQYKDKGWELMEPECIAFIREEEVIDIDLNTKAIAKGCYRVVDFKGLSYTALYCLKMISAFHSFFLKHLSNS